MKEVFKRTEKKYLITPGQYHSLTAAFDGRLGADQYSEYFIANLYYDTPDYALIRASIEKPAFKEKLRLRSYQKAEPESPVFVEMKRKVGGVVYKRRIKMPYREALSFLAGDAPPPESQIGREAAQLLARHTLAPVIWLGYQRKALAGIAEPDLRITFDTDIRFRRRELRLDNGSWGTPLLEPGHVLMEIKAEDAFPLWLSRVLSEKAVFPVSFSKYGTCYTRYILPDLREEARHSA